MNFRRSKPRFVAIRHLSVEDSIRRQAQEEIGTSLTAEPLPETEALMIRLKYGVICPQFTGVECQVIRGETEQ